MRDYGFMGSRPSAIATLVERTGRFTVLVALPEGIEAEQVTPHLTRVLHGLPASMRRTLTWDRGREIAGHRAITAATQTRSISANPAAPGSAAPTRTPTGCCANTYPRALTCADSTRSISMPSLALAPGCRPGDQKMASASIRRWIRTSTDEIELSDRFWTSTSKGSDAMSPRPWDERLISTIRICLAWASASRFRPSASESFETREEAEA